MKRITDSRLTPLLNITGEGIRRAREEAGYTQKQLSIKLETKAVYICRGSLSRVEHGSRIVTDLELQAISEVLNVPMERLRLSKNPWSAREGQSPLEFPCSFCARKSERFQQKLVGVAGRLKTQRVFRFRRRRNCRRLKPKI